MDGVRTTPEQLSSIKQEASAVGFNLIQQLTAQRFPKTQKWIKCVNIRHSSIGWGAKCAQTSWKALSLRSHFCGFGVVWINNTMLQISPCYRTFFLRLNTLSTAESRIIFPNQYSGLGWYFYCSELLRHIDSLHFSLHFMRDCAPFWFSKH